jgi:hypothetical protein
MRDDDFMRGGNGEVIAIRLWESELMVNMRMTEEEYLEMDRKERARKVVAMKLRGWFDLLEYEVSRHKRENKRGPENDSR